MTTQLELFWKQPTQRSEAVNEHTESPVFRIEFEGRPVVAVQFRGRWCWLASQISVAIGYQQPHRLASKVSGTWADEFVEGHDYDVLSGKNLRDFRELVNLLESSKFDSAARRRTVVFYESGLHLALLKTAMPKGKQLRRLLAQGDLTRPPRDGDAEDHRMREKRSLELCEAPQQRNSASLINLDFDGHPVVAVQFRGRWCWLASQISVAIGYQQPRRLASKVSGTWADEFIEGQDYAVLSGSALNDLRHLLDVVLESGTTSLGATVPKVTVLYESGLHLALQKTHLPAGKKLRRILAEKVLPQLIRDGRFDPSRKVDDAGEIVDRETRGSTASVESDNREDEREERRLSLQEAEFDLRRRQVEAGALLRLAERLGDRVGDDVLDSLAVSAAEIESGRLLGGFRPPADESLYWESPKQIAERRGVSLQTVGRAISDLGIRGEEGFSRAITNKAAHCDRTVVSYLYSPEAVEQIESWIAGSRYL